MNYKNIIRSILNALHLDLTKNLEYDRLTKVVMKQNIVSDSNCIDIGCHKGEILEILLKLAPKGQHFAFEPIPPMFSELKKRFTENTTILPYALSDKEGSSTFHYVKNAPAYSGIKQRKYDIENPEIEKIEVQLKKLDDIIPLETKIDLVKIDVEGAEYGVLKGGVKLLNKNKPLIVFECGKGASEFYEKSPKELYNLINQEIGLNISTLKSFLNKENPLNEEEFINCFETNKEYYFIAHP